MGTGDWIILVGLLFTVLGGFSLWVLSRFDRFATERDRSAEKAHDGLRDWARELFADKSALARLEERIIRIDATIENVSSKIDQLLAAMRRDEKGRP